MAELRIDNLTVTYPTPSGPVDVVRSVSLRMGSERVGIVGESGSGKSTLARAILGLVRAPGAVRVDHMSFDGLDLTHQTAAGWRAIRGRRIAMILQDPKFSLNPVLRVGTQIAEAGLLHGLFGKREARQRVLAMLQTVGVDRPERVYESYPHQLSGGIGQRVMIAAMMMAEPGLIIADEPTSALDVMVRGQVLGMMDAQVRQRGMGMLMISHDLNMVVSFCDRVLVMYRGAVVDSCAAKDLYQSTHPYTQGLLNCLRRPRPVGAGCGASLGRSGAERADCTAVLGLAARRGTRCAPCRRSAQTAATRMFTNALRAGRKPCAPRRPRGAPHPAPTGLGRRALVGVGFERSAFGFEVLVGSRAEGTTPLSLLQSVAAGGARWWRFQRRAEERRRRGGARSALRCHSHRGCLSVAPAGRAASSSMRPGGEHRRSVGAFSARPRRCEPPPGTACRDARQRQGSHLGVIAHMCDRVAVMQQGAIVETLPAADIASGRVSHAYTRELLDNCFPGRQAATAGSP
jgi:peptide/nickel transport system ATP-binding protein